MKTLTVIGTRSQFIEASVISQKRSQHFDLKKIIAKYVRYLYAIKTVSMRIVQALMRLSK